MKIVAFYQLRLHIFLVLLLVLLGAPYQGLGNALDFSVKTLGSRVADEPHILVVGGIQGDEPGGFSAASLLVTHYTVTKGSVTVVPNLNFLSIIRRSRGTHGDMNRKFAELSHDDPQYHTVNRIKNIIASPEIEMVINLHDGSGYYNPKHLSKLQNPYRWGNCVIIDQEYFAEGQYSELDKIARFVTEQVNTSLLKKLHRFNVNNTKTGEGNKEMAKTLTWFALRHGKSAFGLEASKELSVSQRTYYHLLGLEAFFKYAGIEFERKFELNPKGIQTALSNDIYIGFVENRIVLPLNGVRRWQVGSFPLEKSDAQCDVNSPILAAVYDKNMVQVHYGNNHLTKFKADWHEVDRSIDAMQVVVDGVEQKVSFGDIVFAKNYFSVVGQKGYRVNAIGAVVGKGARGDESNKKIFKRDFQERFSVNNGGTCFRVEVYRGKKYVGTFVVMYQSASDTVVASPLPAVKGEESDLGR